MCASRTVCNLALAIFAVTFAVLPVNADVALLDDHFTSFDGDFWLPSRHMGAYEYGYPEVSSIVTEDGRSSLYMQSHLSSLEARGYESQQTYANTQVIARATAKVVSGTQSMLFDLQLNPNPLVEEDVVSVYLTPDGSVRGSVWIGGVRHYTAASSADTWQFGNWYTLGFTAGLTSTEFFLLDANEAKLWSDTLAYTLQQVNSAGPSHLRFFSAVWSGCQCRFENVSNLPVSKCITRVPFQPFITSSDSLFRSR